MRLLAKLAFSVLLAAPLGVGVGVWLWSPLGAGIGVTAGLYGILAAATLLVDVPDPADREVSR